MIYGVTSGTMQTRNNTLYCTLYNAWHKLCDWGNQTQLSVNVGLAARLPAITRTRFNDNDYVT